MLMLSANLDVTTQLFSRQKDRGNSLVVSRRDEETASESFMIPGFKSFFKLKEKRPRLSSVVYL